MGIKDLFTAKNKPRASVNPSFSTIKQMLTTTTQDNTTLNTQMKTIGAEHSFDGKITAKMYREVGLVTGIVDKFVTRITGGGFHVTSPTNDSKAIQLVEDWVRDTQFQVLLEDWVREAVLKPGGYLELGGKKNEKINGVKIINGNSVYVLRDKKGKILKYNQWQGNKGYSQDKPIPLEPYQVAALHFRQLGDDAYGQGIIWPIRFIIDNLLGIQKDMHTLIHRKANAPLHVKIGALDGEGAFIPSQDVIDEYAGKLNVLTDKTEFVTDPYFEFNVVDFGQIGEKFDAIIQNDIDMLVFATQIPEVLLGKGNIPEGLAKVQDEDFAKFINSFQQRVEKVMEEQIFSRVLQSQGINSKVEVVWGQPTNSERESRITRLKELLTLPTLNAGLRLEIEKDLAQTLGYSDSVLSDDEPADGVMSAVERDEFEELEQPLVPGENNQKLVTESFDYGKADHTLKEWLDFDYTQYLDDIQKVISKEQFVQLKASNAIEEAAGLLNENQVNKFREVMKQGFSDGMDMKQIASLVEQEVNPGTRYKIQDGALTDTVQVPASKRSMLIARTESTRIAGEGAKLNYKNKGVEEYSVLAAASACSVCQVENGLIIPITQSVPVPLHPNCRCSIVPVIKE